MSDGGHSDFRRNIKLILEYDGTGLAGWQRQADLPTVQSHLEAALSRLTGEEVTVIGAGRTDAGVHARGQVANFRTNATLNLEAVQRGGNALLPPQIAILSAEEVPLDFHARFSATGKTYDYDLWLGPVRPALLRNFVWHISMDLDVEGMCEALKPLVGEHDFSSFQSTGSEVKTVVRRLRAAELTRFPEGLVRITLDGDGFLRHMVRAVVGTMVEVGRGRIRPSDVETILAARNRDRAGPTAPARGLFLRTVRY